MTDTITFFDNESNQDFEDDPGLTMWTEDHTFQPPDSHAIRGVFRLVKGIWYICTVLASNREDKDLIWPAVISWTLSVVKGRRCEDLGSDKMTWTKDDVGKCDWKRCITVPNSDLEKDGMVNADGSVTFMWFAQLNAESCVVSGPVRKNGQLFHRNGHRILRQANGDRQQGLKRKSHTNNTYTDVARFPREAKRSL